MTIPCVKCGVRKLRNQFPKQRASWCLACLRLYTRAQRIAMAWTHGASGYKNHKCRCPICRQAWSVLMRERYEARNQETAPAPVLTSWWTEAPADHFTAFVEREQAPRMRVSRIGQGNGKPYTTDEVSR